MKTYRKLALVTLAGILTFANQTRATLVNPYGWDGIGSGLQTRLNPLVVSGGGGDTWNPGSLSGADYINGTIQNGQTPFDIFWNLAGPGASATLVLEIAGNAGQNKFGFYDPANLANKAQLFSGPDASGDKVYVKFSGNQLQYSADNITYANVGSPFGSTAFGMYLKGPGGTFYSDPTKNAGGGDNLVAYQGYNGRKINIDGNLTAWDAKSYVLGWEDLVLGSSDKDYQDMVLLVSQITPVPEPATVIAGALLLLPFAVSTLRIWRKKRMI